MSNTGLLRAEDVTGNVPTKVWPDPATAMLYRRQINVTAGPSGVGKSLITLKRAAMISNTLGPIIYCNAEDDTVIQRFRFELSGADLKNVHFGSFRLPGNLRDLEAAINDLGAVFVVFDTAAAHIDGPMQRWDIPLKQLQRMLERTTTECMVDMIHHTNKNVKKSANWRAAIGGSTQGLIGTARSIQLVGARPGQSDQQVVMCPVKDSYAAEPLAVAFEFERDEVQQADGEDVEISYMSLAEKNIKIDDPTLLVHVAGDGSGKRGPNPEQAAAAADFLTTILADGVRPKKDCYRCLTNPDSTSTLDDASRKCGHVSVTAVGRNDDCCPDCDGPVSPVEGIETLAEAEEVSKGTMKRAKAALTIESGRKGMSHRGIAYWRLPAGHPSLTPNAPEDLA